MKIGKQDNPYTSISSSNEQTIVVRGRDLVQELIGRLTFTEYLWLLLTGAPPTDQQRRILDATLVSIAEHGLVPSVVAARVTLAAAPEALQGAVAAGLLGCGSVILGSSQAAGEFLDAIVRSAEGRPERLRDAAEEQIKALRAAKRAIPGFGHPLHKAVDPRALKLFQFAEELQIRGPHVRAVECIEELLPVITGKVLKMNISAAIPAVLLDAGYPVGALKGVPLLARTASLIAHLLEEQQRSIGFIMADAASQSVQYDGPAPEGFMPSES